MMMSVTRRVVSIARGGALGAGVSALGRAGVLARSGRATSTERIITGLGREGDVRAMLQAVGARSLEDLVDQAVPHDVRRPHVEGGEGGVPQEGSSEFQVLERLQRIAAKNKVAKNFIGQGYHGSRLPEVVKRHLLENPSWYSAYTPYQSEISQGRLEATAMFQTVVRDLTGLPVANASLLDEGGAVIEGSLMAFRASRGRRTLLASASLHPQTSSMLRSRLGALDLTVIFTDDLEKEIRNRGEEIFGVVVQYPDTQGAVRDFEGLATTAGRAGALLVAACDPLALSLLRPPGEFGADIAVGTLQRFGTPMGYGGPHAAFIACKKELVRSLPGRIVGTSIDSRGKSVFRLALQTREQHIRKEKATSNICTAQALLATTNAIYAAWHGASGLEGIARRVASIAHGFADACRSSLVGWEVVESGGWLFDTVVLRPPPEAQSGIVASYAARQGANLRVLDEGRLLGVTFDETHAPEDAEAVLRLLTLFCRPGAGAPPVKVMAAPVEVPAALRRTSAFLTGSEFQDYRTEVEMTRFLRRLGRKDLALDTSMIPLGSCTMKLNPASSLAPLLWKEFADIHPFAPNEQAEGYHEMLRGLATSLSQITGLDACSLQPNAGAMGELAGLQAIRAFHATAGQAQRDVCLIPESAHGTNAASAALSGLRIVRVKNGKDGEISEADLRRRLADVGPQVACLMMTFPSTHGVFEKHATRVCKMVHEAGGQVYMDGANMNALLGLSSPGAVGVDACHVNLHKTFAIPHGGGGPGCGPICVRSHLKPFLPGHSDPRPLEAVDAGHGGGQISAAPFGSAMVLPISWSYIHLMGWTGLQRVAKSAILSANYMRSRLSGRYDVRFLRPNERCAHEFILDVSEFYKHGITEADIAKRLMDFGFHAPTMSWPVPKSLMVEPTEAESKDELDRYCDALLTIRDEIDRVASGEWPADRNPLVLAPHTVDDIVDSNWDRPYSRETAAFPLPWVRERGKFWPSVNRVDDAHGEAHGVPGCSSQ